MHGQLTKERLGIMNAINGIPIRTSHLSLNPRYFSWSWWSFFVCLNPIDYALLRLRSKLEVNAVLYIREESKLIGGFNLLCTRIIGLSEDVFIVRKVSQIYAELLSNFTAIGTIGDLKI